jgi:exocyst complex component 4
MTDDKCIPVQISLQFMDSSSLGLAGRYPRFKELHMQLQSALRAIVNEHHQGFNSSIGTFHSIQSALQTSQHRLRTLKESLAFANTSLSATKSELEGLATGSQNYDDMLNVLTSM